MTYNFITIYSLEYKLGECEAIILIIPGDCKAIMLLLLCYKPTNHLTCKCILISGSRYLFSFDV